MSLKVFHIVFITMSVLLAVGFGVWAIVKWTRDGQLSGVFLGVLSLVGAGGLPWYGIWFWRKLKGIS